MAAPVVTIVEPTFSNGQHAPLNAALIQAVASSGAFRRIRFFAAPTQQRGVMALLPDRCRRLIEFESATIGPPGGVRLSRGIRQLALLWGSRRQTDFLLMLSSGPETFFVCRLLCLLRRHVRIAIILHGNLESAAGWRSRDPRRRLFDYRTGLGVAIHPNIRLIVLEPAIKRSMERHGIPGWERISVLPHPVDEAEFRGQVGLSNPSFLTLGFIGHAKRSKGFTEFLDLARHAKLHEQPYEFVLAGFLLEDFPADDLAAVACPSTELSRENFLDAVSTIDYACLPFDPKIYEFTASGSLLDAVCGLKPMIAVAFPALLDLVAEFGPLGFVCQNLESMRALLAEPARLLDEAAYAGFQGNLRRLRESRLPSALAQRVAVILRQLDRPEGPIQ